MHNLVIRLKGGLGNQMFQYATARALALKLGMHLIVDTTSGFVRDRVYRRNYALGSFPLTAQTANPFQQLPFWYEQVRNRLFPRSSQLEVRRPWGTYLGETQTVYLPEIDEIESRRAVYMDGYWQSEQYFSEYTELLNKEFTPPTPQDDRFTMLAARMADCNSVAVGVRLFEEVPGQQKEGVGGLVPHSFYSEAAARLAQDVADPVFFLFCTTGNSILHKLQLPGPIHYVTHDNGYLGEMKRLWLLSRCRHHILSNSSFYWWGAWLAEHIHKGTIITCDQFPNTDCVPTRWSVIPTRSSNCALP